MDIRLLLQKPFSELQVSETFCTQCTKMGYRNLEEILSCTPQEILSREGFSYLWLEELIVFLKENGLLHLLQPMPGRSAY